MQQRARRSAQTLGVMDPTSRDFLNLAVIAHPLPQFIADCHVGQPDHFVSQETNFRLPLQPYTEDPEAAPMLLWSPRSNPNLTAFMPNVGAGGYFVVDAAYRHQGRRVAQVRITSGSVEYPINEFICFSGGKLQRIVRSMRDSPRWQFYAEGEVQPYENVSAYTARRIKDRLVRETVLQYLAAWGARVEEPDFWLPSGKCFTFVSRDRPHDA